MKRPHLFRARGAPGLGRDACGAGCLTSVCQGCVCPPDEDFVEALAAQVRGGRFTVALGSGGVRTLPPAEVTISGEVIHIHFAVDLGREVGAPTCLSWTLGNTRYGAVTRTLLSDRAGTLLELRPWGAFPAPPIRLAPSGCAADVMAGLWPRPEPSLGRGHASVDRPDIVEGPSPHDSDESAASSVG